MAAKYWPQVEKLVGEIQAVLDAAAGSPIDGPTRGRVGGLSKELAKFGHQADIVLSWVDRELDDDQGKLF